MPEQQQTDPELEHDTISFSPEESAKTAAVASALKVDIPSTEPAIIVPPKSVPPASAPAKTSLAGTLLVGFGMLIIGAFFGLSAYHFLLAPKPPETTPLPTEMRSENIPLTAFEENRRSVDSNPTGYIGRYGTDPRDCEDHYLLARAYLLVGDYKVARAMLIEARNRLGEADERNRQVIQDDIAIMLTAISDTTVQTGLKKALETAPAANTTATSSPVP